MVELLHQGSRESPCQHRRAVALTKLGIASLLGLIGTAVPSRAVTEDSDMHKTANASVGVHG